jgi:preprotein translocase subunit SecG
MLSVLIVVHLLIVVALVGVVLLQRSEGGVLGSSGGGGFMTGRAQANALTKATAILATLFFVTSISLTVLAGWGHASKSILDKVAPATGSTPAKTDTTAPKDGTFDLGKSLKEQEKTAPAAPAAPEAPKSQ